MSDEALFALGDDGTMTPPIYRPSGHGVALTDYGAHAEVGPEAAEKWKAGGYCATATYSHDDTGRAEITHLCSKRLGHDGEHKCDRCMRRWGCLTAWDAPVEGVAHDHHRCVFGDGEHRRHECRCGAELHTA